MHVLRGVEARRGLEQRRQTCSTSLGRALRQKRSRRVALRGRVPEHARPVLRPAVTALPARVERVLQRLPEDREQRFVRHECSVVRHLHRLHVAAAPAAHRAVRRRGGRALRRRVSDEEQRAKAQCCAAHACLGVPRQRGSDAGRARQRLLQAPKAAGGEGGAAQARLVRRRSSCIRCRRVQHHREGVGRQRRAVQQPQQPGGGGRAQRRGGGRGEAAVATP